MLVNLVPEFLAIPAAPDPNAAYHEYLDRHKPVLQSYWHNYVLDPTSPHAEQVIAATLRAERADLERLLEDVDVAAIAEDALQRSLERCDADCAVDLYLMVGVGAANAGELVVGGRGIAFVCLEHFTGRPNPQTYGMGLAPHLLPLWIAHEVAHAVAPGFEPWEYFGYTRRQYRRIRELDSFLRRAAAPLLDETGLGLRLRFLSGGMSPTARLTSGKVLPERSGYYLGLRLIESYLAERGLASSVRAAAQEFKTADERAFGMQTA